MILPNLTRAIREQNYYAVVLEFLIVIAGVVIGFQITAWNDVAPNGISSFVKMCVNLDLKLFHIQQGQEHPTLTGMFSKLISMQVRPEPLILCAQHTMRCLQLEIWV